MTDSNTPDRNEATRLATDQAQAEAIARRDEALAFVALGNAPRDPQPYAPLVSEALAAADASRRHAEEISGQTPTPDPEGTPAPLADIKGNYAANAEVAAVGGTGIDGSNSVEGTDQPATTADEAGTPALEGAQKIVGNAPVGEPATAEDVAAKPAKRGK